MTSFTVRCTHCDTAFPVDPDKVPDGGVRARCTNCEGIFFVAKPAAAAVAPPEHPAALPEPDVTPEAEVEVAPQPEVEAAPEPEVAPAPEPEVEAAPEPDAEPEPEVELQTPPELETPPEPAAHDPHDQDDAGFGSFDDEIEELDATPMSAAVEAVEDEVSGGPVADVVEDFEIVAPAEEVTLAADEIPAVVDEIPAVVDEIPAVAEEAPQEPEVEAPAVPTGFQFGKRDPHEKARRLARVLVSDMIAYNADRHSQALARGTLEEDFEDEIGKSWEEYVDQVGPEIAESTPYWTDALNEVLAKGEKIF